jgi:hypothetical protein
MGKGTLPFCPDLDYIQIGDMTMPASPLAETLIAAGPPMLDAARFSPANRRRLSGPGLRAFLAIADLWGLSEDERLLMAGLPSRSTWYNWTKAVREHRDVTLDLDLLTRISAVLGIHQALGVLFPNERDGVAWLRTANAAFPFAGRPPMALAACGTQDGLLAVRRFLDAARGGTSMAPAAVDVDFSPYAEADIVLT